MPIGRLSRGSPAAGWLLPTVIATACVVVLVADLVAIAVDVAVDPAEHGRGSRVRVVGTPPVATPSDSTQHGAPVHTTARRVVGPGQILFGLWRTGPFVQPTEPTVWSVGSDGRGERRRPGALPLRLAQISRRNDLSIDAQVLDQQTKYWTGCGVAACTDHQSTSTERGLVLHRLSTGKTRTVTRGGYDSDPAWSPDGKLVAYLSHRVDKAGRERQVVALMDAAGRDLGVYSDPPPGSSDSAPAWAPNGHAIATVRVDTHAVGKVVLLGLDGAVRRTLATKWIDELAWSPDGRQLVGVGLRFARTAEGAVRAVSGSDLWLVDVIHGGVRQLTTFAPPPRPNQYSTSFCNETGGYTPGVGAPSWSNDNRMIAFLSSYRHAPEFARQSDVMVVDVRTHRVRPVHLVPHDTCPSIAPEDDVFTQTALYGWVP